YGFSPTSGPRAQLASRLSTRWVVHKAARGQYSTDHGNAQDKSLAESRRACGGHGLAALRRCRQFPLLAGLDLSVPVFRTVYRYHARPVAPRPGLVGTTPEGRTNGRAPTTAAVDHGWCVSGVHRLACRAGS